MDTTAGQIRLRILDSRQLRSVEAIGLRQYLAGHKPVDVRLRQPFE
jgi:hypothetical protein